MKKMGMDFSENVYRRHKEMTNILYQFEEKRPN